MERSTDEAVRALDDAIRTLDNTSEDWQKVLQETRAKLTEDAQTTIRNEISDVLTRGVGATGADFRCSADFVRGRVRQELVRLKSELIGGTVESREPTLCNIVPSVIDVSRIPDSLKALELYGYNFDVSPIEVIVELGDRTVDVTSKLDRPTRYLLTLNLGPNGVQLPPEANRITLKWNATTLSTITIIQPPPVVCRKEVRSFQPTPYTHIPQHILGDREFNRHGPDVEASATIMNRQMYIEAEVYMIARETSADWTTAQGKAVVRLYSVEPGWRIADVSGKLDDKIGYRDSNYDPDVFDRGSGGPVKRFSAVGDSAGVDAGTQTRVQVEWNPLMMILEEERTCGPR